MKSYVTIEQHVCPVCTKTHDTGALLLDKRLKQRFDTYTVTGFSLCKECEKLHSDGYLALIGIDESKSKQPFNPETVYRTGEIAHIKYEIAEQLFNVNYSLRKYPFIFVDSDVIAKLQERR